MMKNKFADAFCRSYDVVFVKGLMINVMLVQTVINNSCNIDYNCFLGMFSELTTSLFSLNW